MKLFIRFSAICIIITAICLAVMLYGNLTVKIPDTSPWSDAILQTGFAFSIAGVSFVIAGVITKNYD